MVSLTCFKKPSVHPQEDLYLQFYGMFSCVHISSLITGRMYMIHITHPDISSPDLVQPSPHLNCVCGGITFSNFRSRWSNPTPLHRCMFTQCFNTVLQFLLYPENWLVAWLRDYLMELQVPGCGTQVTATPKCAIFSALSSRSVVFHVLYCFVNFVVVG